MPLSENPCEENLWLGNYFLSNLCIFLNIEAPPSTEDSPEEEKETFYNKLKRQLLLQQGKLISLITAREKTRYLEEVEELLSHEELFQPNNLTILKGFFEKRKHEFERLDQTTAEILPFPGQADQHAQVVQKAVEQASRPDTPP